MKRVLDESREPVKAVEATTTIDNIADLDPPGVGCRAAEEKIPPPREEMPPLPRAIEEMMPPEYGPAAPEEIRNFESARLRLRRQADVEVTEFVASRQALNIDRILAALDPKLIPNGLDPDALQNDLQLRIWHYDEAEEIRSPSGEDQFAALRKTDQLAQQLVALLKSEDVRQYVGSSTCESAIGALEDVTRGASLRSMIWSGRGSRRSSGR